MNVNADSHNRGKHRPFKLKREPEEYLIMVMFPTMCILILIATFTRYTSLLVEHFTWCEELARYLMIYIAFLGIGIAAKAGMHYNMTAFVAMLPTLPRKIVELVANLITVVFLGIMTYLSYRLVARQFVVGQLSASLQIPMWIVYSSIFIGMFDMMVRTAIRQVKELKNTPGGDREVEKE
jgi:C4-dicarboxylate transporter DctQ subunit